MRTVSFFFKAIFLFLITFSLYNCSSTDITEEVGVDETQLEKQLDEEERPLQKIDKEDIKVPTNG